MMNAKKAEQISRRYTPYYYTEKEERADTCYKEVMRRINKAASHGEYEVVEMGWDLYKLSFSVIIDRLRSEGYYVRYKYTGSCMDIVVAWGDKAKKYKLADEVSAIESK